MRMQFPLQMTLDSIASSAWIDQWDCRSLGSFLMVSGHPCLIMSIKDCKRGSLSVSLLNVSCFSKGKLMVHVEVVIIIFSVHDTDTTHSNVLQDV